MTASKAVAADIAVVYAVVVVTVLLAAVAEFAAMEQHTFKM